MIVRDKQPSVEGSDADLLREVAQRRRQLERFFITRLLPSGLMRQSIWRTRHFREWYRTPMNYVRIVELPLALQLLDTSPQDRIVDLSSPKLLSLYLAANGWRHLTISDIDDYFIEDFRRFAALFRQEFDLQIIDARRIPLKDASLDKAFSISVFEHIPEMGDRQAVQEVARVIKPGGVFVLTLPAFREYVEEWKTSSSYWDSHSVKSPDGKVFFQRRYDAAALAERFGKCGFEFEEIIYIAEHPIEESRFGPDGRMIHNGSVIERKLGSRRFARLQRKIPLGDYWSHLTASNRCHYLTRSARDPNVRQVALKLRRS